MSFAPENELVLSLLRTLYGAPHVPVDWACAHEDSLVSEIRDHGVLRQAHLALLGVAGAPPALVDRIRTERLTESARSCALAAEVARVSASVNARSLPALAFKGPVLSMQLYGSAATRSSIDLDLLVRPSDLDAAVHALECLGYARVHPSPDWQIVMRHPLNLTVLELHWTLIHPSLETPLDEQLLWRDRVRVEVAGEAVPTTCMEDTILYLAIHGRQHRWDRWKWMCDFAQASSLPLDWDALLRRASNRRCRRSTLVAFALAAKVLGFALPEPVELACRTDQSVATLVEAMLAHPDCAAFRTNANALLMEQFRYRDTIGARLDLAARKLAAAWQPKSDGQTRLQRPLHLYRTYGLRWLREIL